MANLEDEESQRVQVNGARDDEPTSTLRNCLAIVLAVLVVIVGIAVPIAMITIGSLTLGECTVEPMIPYFLIISGITYIIFLPMTILCTVWSKTNACLSCYNGVFLSCVAVFSFAWFICGNVWVYHIRNVEFEDKKSPLYCNELVYQFSFWVIIATYICAVLSCCLSAVFKKQKYDSLK